MRGALAVLGIALVGVLLGRLVMSSLGPRVVRDVDTPVRSFSLRHQNGVATASAQVIGAAGSALVAGPIAAVIALGSWILTRARRPAMHMVAAFTGASFITLAVKYGVHRAPASGPIPRRAPGSFPSGHTLLAIAVYGSLAALVFRAKGPPRLLRLGVAFALVALPIAVAASRVYLLDHYFSDVLASLVLGVALIFVTGGIIEATPERRRASPPMLP